MTIEHGRRKRSAFSSLLRAVRAASPSVAASRTPAWLSALCLAGCSGTAPELPNDIEWRSEHFVYHARAEDAAVCPAVLDQMERHFDAIFAATGLEWPEGRRVHYYKFVDEEDYLATSGCPTESSGCAKDGNAYAYEPFHEHELIHAYFSPLGSPPRILSEGVADLLSCGPLDYASAVPVAAADDDESPDDLQIYVPELEPYIRGSMLAGHLVATYGWEAFLDLYRGPWRRRDDAELRQNLQELYGVSYDSAWATALRGPVSPCVAAWACSAAPLVPGVAETPASSCEDTPYRSVTGTLEVEAEGPGNAAMLLECPADLSEPAHFAGILGSGVVADLGDRSHVAFTSGDTTLTSRRLETPPFGTECAALEPVELDAPEAGLHWLFQPRTSRYFVRLEPSGAAELSVAVDGLADPFMVCPSCEASEACVSVDRVTSMAVSAPVVLHFPAGSPRDEIADLRVTWR